jgi:hypothetical protein
MQGEDSNMHSRRTFLKSSLLASVSLSAVPARFVRAGLDSAQRHFELSRRVPTKYFDGDHCWCHPRAGIVARGGKDGKPRVVMTMNTMDLAGSDVFKALYSLKTDDLGETWTEAAAQPAMAPREETIAGQKVPVAVSDYWPRWHAASNSLLGTGHSVVYTPTWEIEDDRPRHTTYATYDTQQDRWNSWQKLVMPPGDKFTNAGAGCTQRYDEADGTILLPFYYKSNPHARVAVMRCAFDGRELRYLEHGNELAVNDKSRGLHEPSLTRFGDTYYLTIRHDKRGYVTTSRDGLHFDPIREWTFDDGSALGNYNTQQHWVTHSDALFLVYTRRGLNNDHVFRHRAPLVMAQVDPEKLRVIRATEQILVPERGARLGNFGVTDVSPEETWVTVAEWMQPRGCEKYGSDGSVWVARLAWKTPNQRFRQ